MQTRLETCPNCGAPDFSPDTPCLSCGYTARGSFQGLDLGTVDIARAVEQGLDYYLLLGLKPDADTSTIEKAYWQRHHQLPVNQQRVPPDMAKRIKLVEQAGFVLRDPTRRQTYDELRRQRNRNLAQKSPPRDDATRAMDAFRAGRFDDAARLLRVATRRTPDNEILHIQYALSLLYGSSNLASPEDWRVNEMRSALEEARRAGGDSPTTRAHIALCEAVDHYDKNRFAEGWRILNELTHTLPDWYLPWIVSAYWRRREGDLGDMLARGERARRLQEDDWLVANLKTLLGNVWNSRPALLSDAAQRAARLLADGTDAVSLAAKWRIV